MLTKGGIYVFQVSSVIQVNIYLSITYILFVINRKLLSIKQRTCTNYKFYLYGYLLLWFFNGTVNQIL